MEVLPARVGVHREMEQRIAALAAGPFASAARAFRPERMKIRASVRLIVEAVADDESLDSVAIGSSVPVCCSRCHRLMRVRVASAMSIVLEV